MKKTQIVFVSLLIFLSSLEAIAQNTTNKESCKDSLKKAMGYGKLLSAQLKLSDSLNKIRAKQIFALDSLNVKNLLEIDKLTITTKQQKEEILNQSEQIKKVRKRKNIALAFSFSFFLILIL